MEIDSENNKPQNVKNRLEALELRYRILVTIAKAGESGYTLIWGFGFKRLKFLSQFHHFSDVSL